ERPVILRGARCARAPAGELSLGREAAHGKRRILHAHGDATGAEMVRALTENLRRTASVEVLEETFASDLALDNGRVAGVTPTRGDGSRVLIAAPGGGLPTGGTRSRYCPTTHPPRS